MGGHERDLELARRVLLGDRAARSELADRLVFVSRVLSARNRRLGSPLQRDELLDLIQDVQLTIWKKLDTYEGRAALESWAFRFCHLGLLKQLEKRDRRGRRELLLSNDVLSEHPGASGKPRLDDDESLANLLRHLSRREAQVTRLKYLEQLEFAEIGAVLGISTSSAKTHCYRALVKLRGICTPTVEGGRE